MVYEKLFSEAWIRKHPINIFMLGFIFSEIGIISAILVFPEDIGIMSMAFTSLLLLSPINKMLAKEANMEFREKRFSLKLLFNDHKELFEIFFFLFIGILLSYALFSVLLPGLSTFRLFDSQVGVLCQGGSTSLCNAASGGAALAVVGQAACVTQGCEFMGIVTNNLKVLFVTLVFSLAYGAGAVLFLTWNASVWGTIFGFVARHSATVTNTQPLAYFFRLFISVLPHTVVEASSYFFAVIAGGVISKVLLRPELSTIKLKRVIEDAAFFFLLAVILLFIGGWMEIYLFPVIKAI